MKNLKSDTRERRIITYTCISCIKLSYILNFRLLPCLSLKLIKGEMLFFQLVNSVKNITELAKFRLRDIRLRIIKILPSRYSV